jgi:serine/threonine protein kinase
LGITNGVDYFVLEHLEGQTLADRLTKGALPLEQALDIAIQIADALDKAHRAGIVHRDLKPGNIMLTKSGAKLLDFGLAKLTPAVMTTSGLSLAPTMQSPATIQGTILGTLQYMAPEQSRGAMPTSAADIFAFGAVLYEMIAGEKAFDGQESSECHRGHHFGRAQNPSITSNPPPPEALKRTIARCLSKEPDDRWPNRSRPDRGTAVDPRFRMLEPPRVRRRKASGVTRLGVGGCWNSLGGGRCNMDC